MDKFKIGKELIIAGLPLIRIHGIKSNGACTCYKGQDCESPGKHPVEAGWYNKIITSVDQLEKNLKEYPDMNIGIPTGKDLVVVDVDPRHGGQESYEKYKHLFPKTMTVITGGGGLHLYYKKPEGVAVVSNKVNLLPGIDIRADGGFVVAPGSKHKSGNYYKWKEN
jgi:putative DNA primase/helicase